MSNRFGVELETRVEQRTQALAREKEHAEAILNSTSDAIVLVRRNTIEQINPTFTEMYGYDGEEVIGQSTTLLCEPEYFQQWLDARALVHALRTPVRRDFVARRQDGTRFDVEIALSLASPQDPSLTVCIIRDITVRKQVAEQLCAALGEERALRELKSRFIAVVSPEFRNPLSVIRTSTAILRDYSDHLKDDERARHFAKIETQVEHMLALLEDVLAIEGGQVKGSKLERTPTNLVMLCQEVVEGCQITTGTDHPIICRYPETGLDRVELDPKLIRQLMTNLVSNAIKYSRDQGSIYVDLTVNEEAVELRVQDEGIGIPEEDQQHLFQAFHRATNAGGVPGTGLGLLVAQNAAELRGGTIQLESRVGVGTTITVTIPLTHGVPITCRPA